MSKENHPKDWKKFRLADGTERYLPEWANQPLGFKIDPEDSLAASASTKPKNWKKALKSSRKHRR